MMTPLLILLLASLTLAKPIALEEHLLSVLSFPSQQSPLPIVPAGTNIDYQFVNPLY
jgi:hypothetical protein